MLKLFYTNLLFLFACVCVLIGFFLFAMITNYLMWTDIVTLVVVQMVVTLLS